MTAGQCSCGFTELADEEMTDHLNQVFEPEDGKGNDGLVHEERASLACLCGLAASTTEELDQHFLRVFAPDDSTGREGKRHEARRLPRAGSGLSGGQEHLHLLGRANLV